MSKFAQLQSSAILQMAGEEPLSQKMSAQARQFAAAAALIVIAGIADPALAQNSNSPVNPSNCANVGAGVGAIVGGMAAGKGADWQSRALGAALGGFGGKVAGHFLCAPREQQVPQQVQHPQQRVVYVNSQPQPQPQVVYVQQPAAVAVQRPSSGTAHQPVGMQPASRVSGGDGGNWAKSIPPATMQHATALANAKYLPATPAEANEALAKISAGTKMQALSSAEKQRLDAYTRDVLDKKVAWKSALYGTDGKGADPAAVAAAQAEFEAARKEYAVVVYRLAAGSQAEGKAAVSPRDVSRYLEVSASLLELPTQRGVTWQQVVKADTKLENESPQYSAEVAKANDARVKYLR